MTVSSNLTDTAIAGFREGMPPPGPPCELPLDLELTRLTTIKYRYAYDQNGNWTERTGVHREGSYEGSTVKRRTLTYF